MSCDQSAFALRGGAGKWPRVAVSIFAALRARWVVEMGVLIGLLVAYNVIRAAQGTDAALAVEHSRQVLQLQGSLFFDVEVPLNTWIGTVPVVAVAACYFYALMHYFMTPVVLLMSRRAGGTQYWRGYWAIVIASAIALFVYAAWPMAPPRLVPDLGIADVMRNYSDYGWWGSAASAPRGIGDATNQYAAMPSLHFGWSLWCAIQLWALPTRRWRAVAVAYPTVQAVVVLATGNHFLLDVLGGAVCVGLAYVIARILIASPASPVDSQPSVPSTPHPAAASLDLN